MLKRSYLTPKCYHHDRTKIFGNNQPERKDKVAWAISENREGVELADQALQLAEEKIKLADGRYKLGLRELLEFNDAVLLLTENQSSLVITYYNLLIELVRLERAIGIIPELAGYEYPQ